MTLKPLRIRPILSWIGCWIVIAAFAAPFFLPARVEAWHDEGHVYAALAATRALPDDVPAFFRENERAIAHMALDPDTMRHDRLPQLAAMASPEHYFDWEWWGDEPLPDHRYALIERSAERDIPVDRMGFLPYGLTEAAQRLTVAFAEYRQNPDNEHVQRKCLVYAGRLAHYAADLHQPLHTTVHFDGRTDEAFNSPHTGIHTKVDALPTKIPYQQLFDEPLPSPEAHDDMFELVKRELRASHALVDRVYELEDELPAWDSPALEAEAARQFAIDRMRAAAQLIAALQLSAWHNSVDIDLPHWLDRNIYDDGFDESAIPPQPGRGE